MLFMELSCEQSKDYFLEAINELDFEELFPFALIIVKVIANYDFFFREKQYEALPAKERKDKKM